MILKLLFGITKDKTNSDNNQEKSTLRSSSYSIDSFIDRFKLDEFIKSLDTSLENLPKLDDIHEFTTQELNEICDREQFVTINLFTSIYLDPSSENYNIDSLIDYAAKEMIPWYQRKFKSIFEDNSLNSTLRNIKIDHKDTKGSTTLALYFLLARNLPIFCTKLATNIEAYNKKHTKSLDSETQAKIDGILNSFNDLHQKIVILK